MKKKLICISLICTLLLLSLTGCTKKTALTTEKFKSIAQSHSYTITDAKSQYSIYPHILEATIAGISNQWQVEFFVLNNEENTQAMFNTNKTLFENNKNTASIEKSYSLGNKTYYSLTSNGLFMYICIIDNTLLYTKVSTEYKDTVKDFIKELKY